MSGCLGCQRCEDGPVITLIDGRVVCNYCPDYRAEFEARHVLAMPSIHQRREFLHGKLDEYGKPRGGVLQVRGAEACEALERLIRKVFEYNKRNA